MNFTGTAHQQIKQAAAEYGWTIGNYPAVADAYERDTLWVLARPGHSNLVVEFTCPREERRSSIFHTGTDNGWVNDHFGFKSGGKLAKVLAYLAASDEDARRIATTPPAQDTPSV